MALFSKTQICDLSIYDKHSFYPMELKKKKGILYQTYFNFYWNYLYLIPS